MKIVEGITLYCLLCLINISCLDNFIRPFTFIRLYIYSILSEIKPNSVRVSVLIETREEVICSSLQPHLFA